MLDLFHFLGTHQLAAEKIKAPAFRGARRSAPLCCSWASRAASCILRLRAASTGAQHLFQIAECAPHRLTRVRRRRGPLRLRRPPRGRKAMYILLRHGFVEFSRADRPQVSQTAAFPHPWSYSIGTTSCTVSLTPASLTTSIRPSEPFLSSSASRRLQLSGIIKC